MIALEIAVVALIILLNGFFAMSELAILSSRRPRLQQLAANGDHRARIALTLVDNSSRFLAVVQIGIDVDCTIMTARPDVSWINIDDSKESVLRKVRECSHTQLLVSRGSIDEIVGVVDKQNLLDQALDSRPFDIEVALQAPLIVHEGATILRTLDLFKKTPAHTAVIIDEYGIVQGTRHANRFVGGDRRGSPRSRHRGRA